MFNLKNLFSVKKSESNYSLNYDFKSIKVPEKKASHILVFTGGISPAPKNCVLYFKNSPKPDYIIAADSGISPAPKNCVLYFKNSPKPDYIIAADSGLETLSDFQKPFKKLDLLPDAVLGDMDSLKNKKLLKEFSKMRRLKNSTRTKILQTQNLP